MIDQRRNVFAALAQRRQLDVKDVETIEEVGAELPFLDEQLEVLVGGGDDAEIDLDGLVAADAHDLALLQDAQQVGLRLEADVADLVEEDRAAFGDFELALLAVLRSGECAFLVAEQFAFEQRLGERAAVNDDHGMIAAVAGGVNGAGDEFLAGAALAGDEDGGIGGADGFDGLEDALHGRALPDDVGGMRHVGDGFLEAGVLLQGVAMRHGLAHEVRDLVGIERLVDVVVGAVLERGDGGLDRGVAGHDDDQHVGIDFVQAALQLDAIGAAHLDIDERDIEGLLGHAGERFVGALGGGHVVAFFGKPFGERIAHAQFVVNNQQFTFESFLYLSYFVLGRRAIFVAGQRWPLAVNRQQNCETGSLPYHGVDGNAAAVALDNVLADGQAESGAARFLGGVERLEDVGQMFVGDAHAVVANDELQRGGGLLAGADPEIAALRHGVDGVDHHGEHDLLDLVGIAVHVGQLFAEREIELDAAPCPSCAAPGGRSGR